MSGAEITIHGADGDFMGYLATPASGSGPGVVVAQEIFGVNQVMRDVCDRLADQGFMALCPDIFWRQEPGIQLTDQTEAEWQRAFQLYQGFDVDKGVDDIKAAIEALRGTDGCTGKVGGVGYCLGGFLAYLMATRTPVDCSVGYYGVGIDQKLDESGNISHPLMLHVATEDAFVPKEAQAAVADGLGANANITIHTYEGNDHAFARPGGEHYDEAAANLADSRSLEFFNANLN
jgi:carboxymethylenebutenolidase